MTLYALQAPAPGMCVCTDINFACNDSDPVARVFEAAESRFLWEELRITPSSESFEAGWDSSV